MGARLFAVLNTTLFASIWLVVPLLTADCVSREKREGTLGLLFLTPLTPGGVVIGKSLIHCLRGMTLFFAMLPVLMAPFLLGGVGWREAAPLVAIDACSLLLAMAAGLLASCWATDWIRAVLVAETLSGLFCLLFMNAQGFGFAWMAALVYPIPAWAANGFAGIHSPRQYAWFQITHWGPNDRAGYLLAVNAGLNLSGETLSRVGFWAAGVPGGGALPVKFQNHWLGWVGGSLAASFLALVIAMKIAAAEVSRVWRDRPPAAALLLLQRIFCTPVILQKVFQRKMSRTLDRNPVGWLQQYSWSARLAKWGWCLVIVIAEIYLVSDASLDILLAGQYWLGSVILLSLAFSSAASFRREKETGAMELLLVTPLRVDQIISGRMRGIWGQFIPSVALLLLVWLYLFVDLSDWYARKGEPLTATFVWLLMGAFLTVPVIGFFLSFFRLNIVAAWLLTCLLAVVAPVALATLWRAVISMPASIIPVFVTAQLIVASAAWWRLDRLLRRRTFTVLRDTA